MVLGGQNDASSYYGVTVPGIPTTAKYVLFLLARAARMNNPRSWRGAKDWLYNGHTGDRAQRDPAHDRTRLQKRALDEMGLPHNAQAAQVRERYGALIKQYHPDSNGGDRSMEHRLHVVIRAFKALKSSGIA